MNAKVDNLPKNDVVALLQEVMTDPVMVAETGHTYERAAILRWLLTNRSRQLISQLIAYRGTSLIRNRNPLGPYRRP